nr:hypothetical protein [Tanacetum cinerariifolium]
KFESLIMDGNKDEALRCLNIGKDALGLGDRNKALKFMLKAKKLDPSLEIDDLLSSLESDDGPKESPSVSGPVRPENGVRRRVPEAGSSSGVGGYGEDQVTIVSEIKRKKDYYEILGLEKSCSVEDVRKAYRKLSLKVHPDKNKAPGSEEAFKKVSKAFQCLSVEENRKQYDLVGSDEPVYERRAARRMQGGNGSSGMRTLIQLIPVILIILLNFLPSNEPVYSLSRSYGYDHVLTTQKGINFYVKSRNFENDYPLNSQERVQLEEKIEDDYLSIITHNCRLEMQRLQWGYYQPTTPNCDRLKQFEALAS